MSQSKMAIVSGGGLMVFVGVIMFVVLGREASGPSAQARFQARLEAARAAGGVEQIAEGTARATSGTTETPGGRSGVIAWAAWQQVRPAGSDFYRGEDLELGSVPFIVETSEGPLLVDGQLRGLSDLVARNRSPPGGVELTIAEGDHVTLLGPISERDGVRGLFDQVIVVTGSYDQWHTALHKNFFVSLPR